MHSVNFDKNKKGRIKITIIYSFTGKAEKN